MNILGQYAVRGLSTIHHAPNVGSIFNIRPSSSDKKKTYITILSDSGEYKQKNEIPFSKESFYQ